MPRTFNDSLIYDASNVFVNTNEFGEVVTWKNRAGTTSSVAVVIAPRRQRQPSGDRPASRRDADGIERIGVTVSRDASASNSLVDRPEIGESFTRAASVDADVRPWQYTGECESFSAAAATYIFERARKQITTRG